MSTRSEHLGGRVAYPVCHNEHHDARRNGEPCGAPLGATTGPLKFVEVQPHFHRQPGDERTWLHCPTSGCGAWNVFAPAEED